MKIHTFILIIASFFVLNTLSAQSNISEIKKKELEITNIQKNNLKAYKSTVILENISNADLDLLMEFLLQKDGFVELIRGNNANEFYFYHSETISNKEIKGVIRSSGLIQEVGLLETIEVTSFK